MNPGVAGALMRAAGAVTYDEAREAIRDAWRHGLPLTKVADALSTWQRHNTPQYIGDGSGDRCHCSHLLAGHYRDRRGRTVCGVSMCGCIEPRPKEASK